MWSVTNSLGVPQPLARAEQQEMNGDFEAKDKRSMHKHSALAESTLPREVRVNTLLPKTLTAEHKSEGNGWKVVGANLLTVSVGLATWLP